MRITQISVTKLFGIFDHVIPLNLDERITIIHGINGVRKTSILELINGFFSGQYSDLLGIPFEEFRLEFDNDIVLKQKIFRKGIILENTKSITTYLYLTFPVKSENDG